MPDQAVSILINASVAGVWVLCMIMGWVVPGRFYDKLKQENEDLKAALDAQARRADVATEAANTTNLILAGLRREARS